MTDRYLEAFARESEEHVRELNDALLAFEDDPANEAAMDRIFRTAHTLKGNCGAMGFDEASELAHAIEDLLESIRADRVPVTPELMDAVFEGVDELEAAIGEAVQHGEVQQDRTDVVETLREHAAAPGLTAPTDGEVEAVLASVDAPADSDHSVYHVRIEVAGEPASHGPAIVDALDDAFDLLGTEPREGTIDAGEFDGTFDAVFASVVERAAVEAALDPVDAVLNHVVTDVTERVDGGSDATEDATGADAASDEATSGSTVAPEEAEDVSVEELLADDEVDQYDDLDDLAAEVEDVEALEDLGDAGSFDDLDVDFEDVDVTSPTEAAAAESDASPADDEPAGASSDEPTEADDAEVQDATAEFEQLKEEVDPVGFDELQEEIEALEFDEYDSDDEVGFDELLGDEELADEDPFGEPESAGDDASSADEGDEPAVDEQADDAEVAAATADTTADDATGADEPDDAGESDEPADVEEAIGAEEPTDVEEATDVDEPAAVDEPTDVDAPTVDSESVDDDVDAVETTGATDDTADGTAPEPADDTTPDPSDADGTEADVAATEAAETDVGGTDDPETDVAEPDVTATDAADADATDASEDVETADADRTADLSDAVADDAAADASLDADDGAETDAATEAGTGGDAPEDPSDDATDETPADATATDLFGGGSDPDEGTLPAGAGDADDGADDEPDDAVPVDTSADVTDDSFQDVITDSVASTTDDVEHVDGFGDEDRSVLDLDGEAPAADADEMDGADDGDDAEDVDEADGGDDLADAEEGDDGADTDGPDDVAEPLPASDGTIDEEPPTSVADEEPSTSATGEETVETEDEALPGTGVDASAETDEESSEFEDGLQDDLETDDLGIEDEDVESALDAADEIAAEEPADVDDLDLDSPTDADDLDLDAGGFDSTSESGDFDLDGLGTGDGDAVDADRPDASDLAGGAVERRSALDPTARFGEPVVEDPDEDRRERIRGLGVPDSESDEDAGGAASQTIPVQVDNLDDMLNLVEGLVTSRARLRRALEADEPRQVLDEELEALEDVTSELQETVMDVRLVPLRTAVGKLPRIVRDVAREQDKDVDFDLVGEDVEMDRSIVSEIGDPLVHLVRNAVDHGIEPPAERAEAGKPETGSVELSARRERDRVYVTVEDDGRGIDPDELRDAAVEKDVRTREAVEAMDDEAVLDLLFEAGFSTTDEVTDVSGRGVGMDVVAETVDSLDGSVRVDSEPGEGTTVELELPVTLAIVEVLFVEVGGEEFGVPVKVVDEIGPGVDLETRDGQAVLSDGGETERDLIRLDEALEAAGRTETGNGMLVHLREDIRPATLLCDAVRGQQEVVVKPFEGVLEDVPGLSGATVLGDGDVVTILDVETL